MRTPPLYCVAVIFTIAAATTVGARQSAVLKPQPSGQGKDDPQACDECTKKTSPDAKSDMHGGLRWYSDADATDPTRTDPISDRFCFVRSVHNLSGQRADYKWDIGGLENTNLEAGKFDKKCGTLGSVANPPKPGPIAVNYKKPDGNTQVWKSTDEATAAQAAQAPVFPELKTVLETQLYGTDGVAEPLNLAVASSVQRSAEGFQYRYAITRRAGGTVSYTVAWTAAESAPFVEQLKSRGLTRVDVSKLGTEPFQIAFTTGQPPRRVEGPLTLMQVGGDHRFSASVLTWVPQPRQ